MEKKTVLIVGAGAAGYFTAINTAQKNPELRVILVEKSNKVLAKVKISGGGRCNVTHSCFEPAQLVKFYPRGEKELRSVFARFQPGDTFEWFEKRGVSLKTEDDGRVFPTTDNSQTIIDCFLREAEHAGVKLNLHCGLQGLKKEGEGWRAEMSDDSSIWADRVVITAGSSPQLWKLIGSLGHHIVEPVPSLFTFNIPDSPFVGLEGSSSPRSIVSIPSAKLEATGPLLVTHWGLSGPGILKLSAWGARALADKNYEFTAHIQWDHDIRFSDAVELFTELRQSQPKKHVTAFSPIQIPSRLWQSIAERVLAPQTKWADVSNKHIQQLAEFTARYPIRVSGKSRYKDEFVTAGGISLKEIDFKTMESKLLPGLYFAGEVVDIDAITGGFNFQAAWSTSWIVSEALKGL